MDSKQANKIIKALNKDDNLKKMEIIYDGNDVLLYPTHPDTFSQKNLPAIISICKKHFCLFIIRYNKIKEEVEGTIF